MWARSLRTVDPSRVNRLGFAEPERAAEADDGASLAAGLPRLFLWESVVLAVAAATSKAPSRSARRSPGSGMRRDASAVVNLDHRGSREDKNPLQMRLFEVGNDDQP